MIAAWLHQARLQYPDRAGVLSHGQSWTYVELDDAAIRLASHLKSLIGQSVGIAIASFPLRLAALAALDRIGGTPVLLPASADETFLPGAGDMLTFSQSLVDADVAPAAWKQTRSIAAEDDVDSDHRVVLFTSGTSGPPKPVEHTWNSLAAAVHTDPKYCGRRWLLGYDPAGFAGMQVWLQSLRTGGATCVVPPGDHRAAAAAIRRDVEFASGTPTFWRMLFSVASETEFLDSPVEQITLGGESVDQGILDALATTFPRARISHIYASTEMGVCFSVHDGQAGFPATLLDNPPAGCRFRIAPSGELEISSTRSMQQWEADDWFATGDLVERRGDRFYFVGRRSGAINVGGRKVYPEEVEAIIREVPGVAEVRVRAMGSSLVGELVAADVRPKSGDGAAELREVILKHCREKLPKYKTPVVVEFDNNLATTDSGKIARRAGDTSP